MKRILQSVAIAASLFFASDATAQLPDNGVYPGGLVLNSYAPSAGYAGNHIYMMGSWDIDSILDAGTPVILDLFATWCGPCWTYHQGGTLEALYTSQGWGGPGNVAIFAVEADANTAANLLEGGGSSQGDWINNTKYPMANHNSVATMFNLAYYPTIVMICPDRTVTEVGQTTEQGFITAFNNCASAATNANDPRILPVADITKSLCQANTADVTVTVPVQNYSNVAINGSYDIELRDGNNTVVATSTQTLNLQPYEVLNVTFPVVTVNAGNNVYTAKITTANDDLNNDSQPINININPATVLGVHTNKEVTIELDMDAYASEVGFALVEGTVPATGLVATWNSLNAGNTDAYVAVGSMTNGTASFSQLYTVANHGCHWFITVDSFGDGIDYGTPNAEARIIGAATDNIPGGWGDGMIKSYDFQEVLGLDENSALTSISLYPNPSKDVANLSLNLNTEADVTINVVNTVGQTVYTDALGNVNGAQNVQINTSNLEEGVYLVNVNVNGTVSTLRISVVK